MAKRRIVDRAGLIAALIDEIEQDPYQANYRLKPVGTLITGWSERLTGYFWPSPLPGSRRTISDIAHHHARRGSTSCRTTASWHRADQLLAVTFARIAVPAEAASHSEVIWETVGPGQRACSTSPDQGRADEQQAGLKVAALITSLHLEVISAVAIHFQSRQHYCRRSDRPDPARKLDFALPSPLQT